MLNRKPFTRNQKIINGLFAIIYLGTLFTMLILAANTQDAKQEKNTLRDIKTNPVLFTEDTTQQDTEEERISNNIDTLAL